MRNNDDEIESLKLHIEQNRLAIERSNALNERFRTCLESLRTDVAPLFASSETSRGMAFEFAKSGIQSTFMLNGGALIVFPAFAQLLDSAAFVSHTQDVTLSMAAFVLGLFCAALATLFAFLAMDNDTLDLRTRAQRMHADTIMRFYPPEGEKYQQSGPTGTENKARGRFMRYQIAGISLWIVSLLLFLFGAYFAARVIAGAGS